MKVIPDFYHGDTITSWSDIEKNAPFVIFKGTEGTNFESPSLRGYITTCETRKIPYWIYAFLRHGDELAQAKYLVSVCRPLVGDLFCGYVLDVERKNLAKDVKEALDWLNSVSAKTMVYTMYSDYATYKELIDARPDTCAWWEARYGKNDGTYRSEYPCHSGADLHQFSDKGKFSGIKNPCDVSRMTGTKPESWFTERSTVKHMKESEITICGHGGGKPSLKKLSTYNSQRYAKIAPNGKRKGVVCVRRFKAMTDAQRVAFREKYSTIIGRNTYSQPRRAYVYEPYSNGVYYSDCSSSGMDTYRRIGCKGITWLFNTAAIYESPLFEDVPVEIVDGHIMNPEVLLVADCILYRGNDPSRPGPQIGHVEYVYSIPEKTEKEKKGYTGEFPVLPPKGDFRKGDGVTTLLNYPTQLKRMQKLVSWITGDKLSIDGEFGSQTDKAVRKAQKLLGVAVDGVFGTKTLASAKKYKK